MSGYDELSSILSKIVQNPEFAGMVKEMQGGEGGQSAEEISANMMASLPDMLSKIGPLLGGANQLNAPKEEKAVPVSSGKPKGSGGRYDKDNAEKLFRALKPYLSKERCEMLDKCMSVMQISDVMNALGGLDGLKKP